MGAVTEPQGMPTLDRGLQRRKETRGMSSPESKPDVQGPTSFQCFRGGVSTDILVTLATHHWRPAKPDMEWLRKTYVVSNGDRKCLNLPNILAVLLKKKTRQI